MQGPKPRLIAVDLDGTLLPDADMEAREKDVAALRRAVSAGVVVAIATGRPHASAETVVERIGLREVPIISFNGAMVSLPGEDKPLLHRKVPEDVVRELLQIAVEQRWHLHYFVGNSLFVPRASHWAWDYYRRTGIRPQPVGDLRKHARELPTKIIIMHDPQGVPAIARWLAEHFQGRAYVTRSQPEMVEIAHPGVDKGRALALLAERLGIRREETVAIGDGPNDVPLIRAAGLGLAMPNASDEAKSAADAVLESNDAPIAEAVERLVLGER
ncbi:MAG: HAD family phosphatase [Armatimonadetes bacterium]|nr:HAD family phosphatase [Armatimonadota bacterium]